MSQSLPVPLDPTGRPDVELADTGLPRLPSSPLLPPACVTEARINDNTTDVTTTCLKQKAYTAYQIASLHENRSQFPDDSTSCIDLVFLGEA